MRNNCRKVSLSQKRQVMKSFERASSVDEMVKAFKEMELFFDESDLGMECMIIAQTFLDKTLDIEQAIHFGKKSLKILLSNFDYNKPSFGNYISFGPLFDACTNCQTLSYFIARVCDLLGSACFRLKRYDESVIYLNWANRNFNTLQDISSCSRNCVRLSLLYTEIKLYDVKIALGKLGEAAIHAVKILDVQVKLMEKDCIEIGEANMKVYKAYCAVLDFEAALPYCLKALEIHERHLGSDSVVVGYIRKNLGIIYYVLGNYDKEIEQTISVLEKNNGSDLLEDLGSYEKNVDFLAGEVSRDDISGEERALLFLSMAKAFVKLGKFSDAKKRMRTAKNILEKKGMSPTCVAKGFGEMSRLYEELNHPETTLSFVRRAVVVPNVPQTILSQNARRFFSLSRRSRKAKEEIPYLEDTVEKLKDSFGPEHYEVVFGYVHLGLAYWNSGQQELGLKFMKNAKDIMDATLGPNHIISLTTSQTLSVTYMNMGRYHQAIEIQEKVVKGLKEMGSSKQELLDKAVMHLNGMKERAAEYLTSDSSQFIDGEDLCDMISKCAISDEGRGN